LEYSSFSLKILAFLSHESTQHTKIASDLDPLALTDGTSPDRAQNQSYTDLRGTHLDDANLDNEAHRPMADHTWRVVGHSMKRWVTVSRLQWQKEQKY
jgi:hypothetical protein